MLPLMMLLLVALPIGWLVSEFSNNRLLRITLGILAIAMTTFCACAVNSMLTCFNYNAWYGSATRDLIQTSIAQIEDGHTERVLKVWRGMDSQYQPTYENRAGYQDWVKGATARMTGDVPIEPRSAWDAPDFTKKTWIGHWEDDYGFWLIVDDLGSPLGVLRSGDPTINMHSVSLSDDGRVLTFKEGKQWVHKLTLKNKYEASHEWFDAEKQTVEKTDTMYKLVRPAEREASRGGGILGRPFVVGSADDADGRTDKGLRQAVGSKDR